MGTINIRQYGMGPGHIDPIEITIELDKYARQRSRMSINREHFAGIYFGSLLTEYILSRNSTLNDANEGIKYIVRQIQRWNFPNTGLLIAASLTQAVARLEHKSQGMDRLYILNYIRQFIVRLVDQDTWEQFKNQSHEHIFKSSYDLYGAVRMISPLYSHS
jgi:hypothetical protein